MPCKYRAKRIQFIADQPAAQRSRQVVLMQKVFSANCCVDNVTFLQWLLEASGSSCL
jgi:hypothetical protein